MIGGGGCRIKYVMWMDDVVRICAVCLATVNTAAINTGFYPSGHFRLPTTCSCQFIVSAVSTDTVFFVGRCSAKAAAAQWLDEDVHILLYIFFQTETCSCTFALIACNATFFGGLLFGAVSSCSARPREGCTSCQGQASAAQIQGCRQEGRILFEMGRC